MSIAIVTGASSGLGREFVRQIARREKPSEIWVIARREDRLQELKAQIDVPVRVLAMDLTKPEEIQRLTNLMGMERPEVSLLINAAGFGKMGRCEQISSRDQADMIDLNCRALVQVTLAVIPYLRWGSRIIQVSSSSAFQPLPSLNVYAATKAFVLRFSRALRWELRDQGVNVTAVCPYWIKDTEFIHVSQHAANGGAIRHFPLAGRSGDVVRQALRDSWINRPVSTPGMVASAQRLLSKFVPEEFAMMLWEGIRRL